MFDNKAGVGWDSGPFVRNFAIDEVSDEEVDDMVTPYRLNPSSLSDTSSISARTSLNFSPFSTPSASTLPWSPAETLLPFFEDGPAKTLGPDPFGSKYDWAFHQQHIQPMNLHMLSTTPRKIMGTVMIWQ